MNPSNSHYPSHGLNCQCITCKWDEYKKKYPSDSSLGPTVLSSFLPQDFSSVFAGFCLGALLTAGGISLWRQMRQNAYASLASSTSTSLSISSDEPIVLVNGATQSIHHILTVDPSLGIIYAAVSGVYKITCILNVFIPITNETNTDAQTFIVSIVRNGLPNDHAAQLIHIEQGITPGTPQVISFQTQDFLKTDDYIQLFGTCSTSGAITTIEMDRLSFRFSAELLKVQLSNE